jgi:host factor-I protein
MSEFNTNFPGVRQIQSYIKDQQFVEIKLNVGETIEGKILWQDDQCICLIDGREQKFLIWKQALVYIKPKM